MTELILQDAFKQFTIDQDKVISPSDTVKHFKKRLKEVNLDILEDTKRIDNGRLGIPVYFSISGRDALNIVGTKKQMGKGGTPEQAEASAVMELTERFSFFSFFKNFSNFFTDKYQNIKDKALSFEKIALSVNDNSDDLDACFKIFSSLPLKWTNGYNLTTKQEVLVPFDWFFTINEFNGACAGNCVEEALIQGISEVIERHVSSIISQNKVKVPVIDLDSASDSLVQEMIKKYKKIGVKLFASDFSLNTGIPTVGLLAYDLSTFPKMSEIVWTAGTTPNPEKSLSRALTEVAQLGGDFNTGSNYMASGLPKFNSLKQADFITSSTKSVSIDSLPDLSDNNIRVEVENYINALKKQNMDVIIVDVTHPGLKIPAFYTIIPGTHFRERAKGASVGMFLAKITAENFDHKTAIAKLKKMEAILPKKYYVQFFMGYSYVLNNDPVSALSCFNEALKRTPSKEDIPSIYSYMGSCLKDMEKWNEALNALKKAEEYDKERTDIYNLMGFCHFKLKKHEKAIDCFKRVIALNPGSGIDYANIASNYREIGEKEKAIEYYQKAVKIDPSIDFAWDNLLKLQGL
ncbi:ribosomal protein S12 methylthiotransferase accessory factor [Candidatus Magnetomoraceae bacterium gMMP-1]